MSTTADQRWCVYHPAAPASICERCGSFVCAQCLAQPELCVHCAAKLKPSRLAVACAALGFVSFCGFAPGVVAIILSGVELSRIAQGRAPKQGSDYARAGMVPGSGARW